MLKFNNNHIFTGYLKQFLSSFNLPTCKIYTAEFEKFYAEHGYEDPRVLESNLPIAVSSSKKRPATGITYIKDGYAQQYFWDTANWNARLDCSKNKIVKYWKSNQTLHYNGNKILGLTKTLKNPTTLYNYQTHEYLGDYLRFLRDYENINLMSMYNCFSNNLCNNIKIKLDDKVEYTEINHDTGEKKTKEKTVKFDINAYDTSYKIYMFPVKLFENYTIAIDCYQGIELFCGFYNEKLDTSIRATDLIKKTYMKVPKALFGQPFIYDKLNVEHWNWQDENTVLRVIADKSNPKDNPKTIKATMYDTNKILRTEIAMRESELKLFIKVPTANTSSIAVLEGDYCNFNDTLYTHSEKGWQYRANSTHANFETKKTYKYSTLPDINSRKFKPISKLQLLALNTGISYPFADRLIEYLVMNVILPNDTTPDNIKRLQKVMEDSGYSFQINGVWEPKMQMILYDYLMNSGKFTVATEKDEAGNTIYTEVNGVKHPVYKTKKDALGKTVYDKVGNPVYELENKRMGNLAQIGQRQRAEFYDILGYVDKDAEKLYASWAVENIEKNGKVTPQVITKTTLENVDIYSNLYNN